MNEHRMNADDLTPTPLNEVPLHGFPIDKNQWWACQHPERPADGDVAYDGRCRACAIAAEAEVSQAGDSVVAFHSGGDTAPARLSMLVERSKRYLEEGR